MKSIHQPERDLQSTDAVVEEEQPVNDKHWINVLPVAYLY